MHASADNKKVGKPFNKLVAYQIEKSISSDGEIEPVGVAARVLTRTFGGSRIMVITVIVTLAYLTEIETHSESPTTIQTTTDLKRYGKSLDHFGINPK